MARFKPNVAFVALLFAILLITSTEARSKQQGWLQKLRTERDFNDLLGLFRRQEDDSVDPACNFVCELDSCGSACSISKRYLGPLEKRYTLYNASTESWEAVSSAQYIEHGSSLALAKRFDFAPRWSKRRIGPYIVGQLQTDPPSDAQFQDNLGFYNGQNMGSLSQNSRLAAGRVVQYGTGSLHGCTMLAVVSNRAVWMAHFWEGYAFRDSARPAGDTDSEEGKWLPDDNTTPGSTSFQRFQNAAMNLLDRNVGTKDGTTTGNRIDWRLFNQEGDNTQVMFMTPVARGASAGSTTLRYPNKIGELQRILMENLPNAKYRVNKVYQPLNWVSNGGVPTPGLNDDANRVDTDEKGQCLFQYDGEGNWRLFFEENFYSSDT